MKLQLVLLAFLAVFVPQAVAQTATQKPNLTGALASAGSSAPKNVRQTYYSSSRSENFRFLRQRQEIVLLDRFIAKLRPMSRQQVVDLKSRLPPVMLRKLVARIKYLNAQTSSQKAQPEPSPGSTGGPNTVMSLANRVRGSGKDSNTVSASSTPTGTRPRLSPALLRRIQLIRRRLAARRGSKINPVLEQLRAYHTYQKKAKKALAAGCSRPMATESVMESFFLFSNGGCRLGGFACYMKGQTCVDIGKSMMCCPLGYNSGVINIMNTMKQVQQIAAQLS